MTQNLASAASLPAPAGRAAPDRTVDVTPRARKRRRLSPLTIRVMLVNAFALVILMGGVLVLDQLEENLIEAELNEAFDEARILAAAVNEGAIDHDTTGTVIRSLDHVRARRILRELYEITDTRLKLIAPSGEVIADSRLIGGPEAGRTVEVVPLPPLDARDSMIRQGFDWLYDEVLGLLPQRKTWPIYDRGPEDPILDLSTVNQASLGMVGRQIWRRADGRALVIDVAVPIQPLREIMAILLVTTETTEVSDALQAMREGVLLVFAGTAAITLLMAFFLSLTITRPILKLAAAAEAVRTGMDRDIPIPDLSNRRDEIGDLSAAMRDMTQALHGRMDAIERFAADVAHEIKNPLTSLRSAVETTARIEDPEKRQRLLSIIQDDVGRLDRLISDISDASRVDAEMSRAERERVDVRVMLEKLAELYTTTRCEDDDVAVDLKIAGDGPFRIQGIEDRLVQVVRNLISNATGFSPKGGVIGIGLARLGGRVMITVSDQGPGIPPAKLRDIFNRFYTERPTGEKFGTHSGLGLSISKQIIDAHRGRIFAENITDYSGAVHGARFTIELPAEPA